MPAARNVVSSYLAALAGDDPDAVVALVAEGFRNEHLSALGASSTGREEYRRRLPDFLDAFTGRRYTIEQSLVATTPDPHDGTTEVVVRYRFRATHDEHPIEVPGVMWFAVRGGLIERRVDVWDSLTFLRQTDQA